MDGVLIVDKPIGPTSFDVVRRVRALGSGRKAGHTGTLDPMATGVLPVCLGDATKIASFITEGDKEYEGVVQLGVETDSYDATGKVVAERSIAAVKPAEVERAVAAMQGEYWQTPPMFSAVKVGGKRLYELARKGEEIERKPRKVNLERIELTRYDAQTGAATIFVHCSKGTYVRSIAHELGEALGVGGHLMALRRLRSGPFSLDRAVPLPVILDLAASGRQDEIARFVVPMSEALAELPEARLDETRARKVAYGMVLGARDLAESGLPRQEEGVRVRITGPGGRLLAVAEQRQGTLRYVRVLVTPQDLLGS
ncbi:tRNA pseudouridine(55) synthase TruB [Vulgatibacter sp.]|uniref:tRNA pseudouridine(55) synthase TruB n=1 Tax=Vulgatibacter sp. TaxID=1971226 RepID=UPI00356750E3